MEQIIATLEKIRTIAGDTASFGKIERDLMLQYTRDLYEAIHALPEKVAVNGQQELTEEPEPLPEEVMEEETVVEEALATMTDEPESVPGTALPEEHTIYYPPEEDRVEEASVLEEPDHTDLYSDLAPYTEEEPASPLFSFELEPELQEEKIVPYQAKHSTDFRIWNKDIRSYIGINDKYNFISELFKGNSEAYDEILNEINQCENKQDALRFLENAGITTLYHWKEDGFSEQIFYNVLSQFFAAR